MAADPAFPRLLGGLTTGKGERWLTLALCVYVVSIVVWPLGQMLLAAFQDAEGQRFGVITQTLSARATGRAFWNTLIVSGISVAISLVLGMSLALLVGLRQLPGRGALTFLILMPLIIPAQTMALSWIELFGPNSLLRTLTGLTSQPGVSNPLYSRMGIALVMGIEHMPLVFIAVRAALTGVPADLIEAARIAAIPPRLILTRIVLPITYPSALAGALLAFTAAVGNFGIPALLGIPGRVPVLTTLIYQRLNSFGPSAAGQVAVLALILAALAIVALILRNLVLRHLRMQLSAGKRFRAEANAAPWLQSLIWLVVVAISILPLLALLASSLLPAVGIAFSLEAAGIDQYRAVLANDAVLRAFVNSLWLSLAAALICTMIALPFAYLRTYRPNPLLTACDVLAELPWVVPGTVVALAMILAFLKPLPLIGISLYGTAAIILIAYLARFLPLVLRPVVAAAHHHDPALDEAARIVGAPLHQRLARIFAPSVLPSAVAGAILIVMTAMNELTLSALLWSSGHETIGVMVFSLQYEGNSTSAAAVSVLSTILLLAICGLVQLLGRRLPQDALPWRG